MKEKTEEKKESTIHTYTTEDIKSELIGEVDSRGSMKSKMPSTIKMEVGHRFAHDAEKLKMDIKEGLTTETGLIGLKLIAVYAVNTEGEEVEKILDDVNLELGETLENDDE